MDLVIDHSVQVDVARSANALQLNMEMEFGRNKERFAFLKWGASAFKNMLVVPPGSGIVHQVGAAIGLRAGRGRIVGIGKTTQGISRVF